MTTTAPTVHTPADVAELRLWLNDQWKPGQPFGTAAARHHAYRSRTSASAAGYASHELHCLQHATLWWVAEDMVDLLLAAAAGIPDDVALADLPHMPGAGLVVFAKPWLGIDADAPNRTVQVDALLWGAARLPQMPDREGNPPALTVSTYRLLEFDQGLGSAELPLVAMIGGLAHAKASKLPPADPEVVAQVADPRVERGEGGELRHYATTDVDRPVSEDEAAAALMADHGPGTVGSFQPDPNLPGHGTFAKDDQHAFRLTGSTWVPLGRSDWPVGDKLGQAPYTMDDHTLASYVEDRKVLAALWHLLHQEGIAQQEVRRSPRPTERRTKRANIDPQLAEVRVVVLRKLERTEAEPDGDEHAKREWSHRWLVSGHWRWQPYGPKRSLRRLTYVRPHVRGPEDKPLKLKTVVNAWTR